MQKFVNTIKPVYSGCFGPQFPDLIKQVANTSNMFGDCCNDQVTY